MDVTLLGAHAQAKDAKDVGGRAGGPGRGGTLGAGVVARGWGTGEVWRSWTGGAWGVAVKGHGGLGAAIYWRSRASGHHMRVLCVCAERIKNLSTGVTMSRKGQGSQLEISPLHLFPKFHTRQGTNIQ